MVTPHRPHSEEIAHHMARAHEWEMISGFVLNLQRDQSTPDECMLKPIADALQPYGLEDWLICDMSFAVEDAGESLRCNCPEGKLDCITVRVQLASQPMGKPGEKDLHWSFYVIKQIASSESDNLEAMDHPSCFIDLHVFRTA